MTEKTQIIDGMAISVCPMCLKENELDASEHMNSIRPVKINHQCTCRHSYIVLLDKRRYKRANSTLPGAIIIDLDGKELEREPITVLDLSPFGLKFVMHEKRNIEPGDKLQVLFHLHTINKSLVKKKVVVRHVNNDEIGAVFYTDDQNDTIRAYLDNLQKDSDNAG